MIHHGRFQAKVAVVTGAAQGIGYTVAANLAREGGKVALVDRSELIHEVREKLVYELRDKLPAGAPRSWRSSPTSSATPTAARS